MDSVRALSDSNPGGDVFRSSPLKFYISLQVKHYLVEAPRSEWAKIVHGLTNALLFPRALIYSDDPKLAWLEAFPRALRELGLSVAINFGTPRTGLLTGLALAHGAFPASSSLSGTTPEHAQQVVAGGSISGAPWSPAGTLSAAAPAGTSSSYVSSTRPSAHQVGAGAPVSSQHVGGQHPATAVVAAGPASKRTGDPKTGPIQDFIRLSTQFLFTVTEAVVCQTPMPKVACVFHLDVPVEMLTLYSLRLMPLEQNRDVVSILFVERGNRGTADKLAKMYNVSFLDMPFEYIPMGGMKL